MRDNVLWRKESRIILALAAALSISEEKALDVYYSTQTARQLSDPKYGLQLMSDGYIVENILAELRGQPGAPLSNSNSNSGLEHISASFKRPALAAPPANSDLCCTIHGAGRMKNGEHEKP